MANYYALSPYCGVNTRVFIYLGKYGNITDCGGKLRLLYQLAVPAGWGYTCSWELVDKKSKSTLFPGARGGGSVVTNDWCILSALLHLEGIKWDQ